MWKYQYDEEYYAIIEYILSLQTNNIEEEEAIARSILYGKR